MRVAGADVDARFPDDNAMIIPVIFVLQVVLALVIVPCTLKQEIVSQESQRNRQIRGRELWLLTGFPPAKSAFPTSPVTRQPSHAPMEY